MTTPRIETSWDDGGPMDLKIARLLRRYKLPGIFFWPVNQVIDNPTWADPIAKDFEIGSHTVNHFQLPTLEIQSAMREVNESRQWLERRFKKPVRWFCYPRGRFLGRDIKLVADAGYDFARTTKVGNAKGAENNFTLPADIHCYQRKEYEGLDWLEYGRRQWDKAVAGQWPTFHIWGHGWELERDGGWDRLEQLFRYVTT